VTPGGPSDQGGQSDGRQDARQRYAHFHPSGLGDMSWFHGNISSSLDPIRPS
jgi:hypothetical protein